jgi:hypothetical protein
MRVFIAVLILVFSLQSLSKADDIRDFQIEGISIGDSALDYFTNKDIKKAIKERIIYPNSQKFSMLTFYLHKNLKIYDSVQINHLTNDKELIIYSIAGINYFENSINECKKEKKIIVNELSEIFKNSEKINKKKKHEYDKSGKSFIHQTLFDLISGDQIRVECYDWSKKMTKKHGLDDQLIVSISHKDFSNFLKNEAY